jgi:hypothetical protein
MNNQNFNGMDMNNYIMFQHFLNLQKNNNMFQQQNINNMNFNQNMFQQCMNQINMNQFGNQPNFNFNPNMNMGNFNINFLQSMFQMFFQWMMSQGMMNNINNNFNFNNNLNQNNNNNINTSTKIPEFINFIFAAGTGLSTNLRVQSNKTIEDLLKLYAKKAGFSERLLGTDINFLFDAEVMKVHDKTKLYEKFKRDYHTITVIDIKNVLGA